jgi:hypothetical protein
MATRPHERRSIWRVGPESTWTTVLPVAFIITSLISLVILPLVVARHTARMRSEITSFAEPARRTASDMQVKLAAELDNIIAFQVTGQTHFRDKYISLVQVQAQDYRALAKLTPKLDEQVDRDFAALIAQTNRWHAGVQQEEFLKAPMPAEVFAHRLFERHPSYEKALDAASDLQRDIQQAIDDRLYSIRDAEQWNMSLTIILTLLALTSAILVAGLGRQMRLLAREAMARRRDAEREATDAKIARAAARNAARRSTSRRRSPRWPSSTSRTSASFARSISQSPTARCAAPPCVTANRSTTPRCSRTPAARSSRSRTRSRT